MDMPLDSSAAGAQTCQAHAYQLSKGSMCNSNKTQVHNFTNIIVRGAASHHKIASSSGKGPVLCLQLRSPRCWTSLD